MKIFCKSGFHNWLEKIETYYLESDTRRELMKIRTKKCRICGKKKVYTLLKEYKQDNKFWKTWNKSEGDTIKWEDLR